VHAKLSVHFKYKVLKSVGAWMLQIACKLQCMVGNRLRCVMRISCLEKVTEVAALVCEKEEKPFTGYSMYRS
jgi:hypothetical protein